MKKVSLLMLVAVFLFAGNLRAQEEVVLLEEDFSAYTVGNNLAVESNAAGNDWWTTWSENPGSSEDGVVAEYGGDKCAYWVKGNDQVLKLNDLQTGVYELEFDILVPDGKTGYFNILHRYDGAGSKYAMQTYLQVTNDGMYDTYNPGHGSVHAGCTNVADLPCVFDQWMHFRIRIDTDTDFAEYYYSVEGGEEIFVCEWQWSWDSHGNYVIDRVLDAMSFYPPMADAAFYFDNFKCKRIGAVTASELVITPGAIEETIQSGDVTATTITIENVGTSIGEYTAWVDYGAGQGGDNAQIVTYALDDVNPYGISWTTSEPKTFEIAALYPSIAYGNSVMGTYITKAACLFGDDGNCNSSSGLEPGTNVIFRIYGQSSNELPGELLAEKVIAAEDATTSETGFVYTVVEFDEPVALTGYDVYVAVELTSAIDCNTVAFDGSENPIPGFGDLYRTRSGHPFRSISDNYGINKGNWCLYMVCEGAPITAGYATLSKAFGSLPIGGSDELTVNLSSAGLADGIYEAAVKFVTNDQDNPEVSIPLTLTIGGDDVAEISGEAYNIYPNPTTGDVTVEGENINYIGVYNSVGKLLNVVKNVNNTVDMSAYENGVYFFNIVDNAGQSALQRVVVAK